MKSALYSAVGVVFPRRRRDVSGRPTSDSRASKEDNNEGRQLFETETFGGNGRTCRTCHSVDTGTVSPRDAAKRLKKDPDDPLFVHDGSDDGLGHGVTRMLADATILIDHSAPGQRHAGR